MALGHPGRATGLGPLARRPYSLLLSTGIAFRVRLLRKSHKTSNTRFVIPAKAGIHLALIKSAWIPAFAGMTIFRSAVKYT